MASIIKTGNIPSVNVNKAVQSLSTGYINMINKNIPFNKMPSVMLWGPPGVGKSMAIREIAENIRKETGKKVNITDVRLLMFNPIDLRGIPTSNKDKTLAIWLRPKIFDMDPSADVINFLFLDEISSAPISVQAAAYQIALDRVVGEHRLPDNCFVIAAGNRVSDKSVAYNMPKALANRLLHFEVLPNFESWKEWAYKNNINDKIIAYLSFKPDSLMTFDPSRIDDLAFATPRSWEMVSNLLNYVYPNLNDAKNMIAGLIGKGVALEFTAFCNIYKHLPKLEDIFAGKSVVIGKDIDVLFALMTSMVAYVREHLDDIDKIRNSFKTIRRFPKDFASVIIQDYLSISKEFSDKLKRLDDFIKLVGDMGTSFNGLF